MLGSETDANQEQDNFIPFPAALFTVSKQMYEDAQEVFWSQRFVLRGDFVSTILVAYISMAFPWSSKKSRQVIDGSSQGLLNCL